MYRVKLNLKENSYEIIIGNNIIGLLGKYIQRLKIGSDAYIITNARIKKQYGNTLDKALKKYKIKTLFKIVPDSEGSKSLEISSQVLRDIARFDLKRRVFIIAFGGGVIGDLSGFIASIYKRGIPYIQVPTTLLAQVDSAIGGKTSVDLKEGKNLIGAFYQPRLVFSDIKFLSSLNQRQIRTGLAEVIKYGAIKDKGLFSYLEKNFRSILNLKRASFTHIIKRCSKIKADIVQRDERDKKGIRAILNFGHTLGHAIEKAAAFKKYNHGEAVALGMLIACDISKSLNLINNSEVKRAEDIIKAVGLPIKINKIDFLEIINAHYRDKKFTGKKNRLVLIKGIGQAKIMEDVPFQAIKEAIKKRF